MPIGAVYRPLLEIAKEAGVDVVSFPDRFGLTEAILLDPPPGSRLTKVASLAASCSPASTIRRLGCVRPSGYVRWTPTFLGIPRPPFAPSTRGA